MGSHELGVHLVVAEARLARATKRLKYLRDSELYGYQDAVAYRTALYEYHAAQRELLALSGAAVMAPRAA